MECYGTQYGTLSEDKREFTPDGTFVKSGTETTICEISVMDSDFKEAYTIANNSTDESELSPAYPNAQEVLRITGTLILY